MWQISRNHILKDHYGLLEIGTVVSIERDWCPVFVFMPHRTVSNRWVWFKKVYSRRVWVYTGFIDEPETQYGELFDILRD